jgi:hypothetical protein
MSDDSLARVLERLAGRLVTGPLAFAAAGIVDVLTYSLRSLGSRVKRR